MYCMDTSKPDIYLQATKDDQVMGKKHVFFIIKAAECSEKTRLVGDP